MPNPLENEAKAARTGQMQTLEVRIQIINLMEICGDLVKKLPPPPLSASALPPDPAILFAGTKPQNVEPVAYSPGGSFAQEKAQQLNNLNKRVICEKHVRLSEHHSSA